VRRRGYTAELLRQGAAEVIGVDEKGTMREVARILAPGGRLVLISPDRWFPSEGHGMRSSFFKTGNPVPLVIARRDGQSLEEGPSSG
jgi:SAM-dependent methyltransferase